MRCPYCLHERSKVLRKFTCEGISGDEIDARYRRCLACDKTFKTYEGLEMPDPEAAFVLADVKRIAAGCSDDMSISAVQQTISDLRETLL